MASPEDNQMFNSMIMGLVLNRAKAIVGFFLAGLGTLIIQSVERGGGLDVPSSWEVWINSGLVALATAWGVYQTPNKPLPTKSPNQ